MLIKQYCPKETPLNALLIGVSGAGKTTSCGSLLRKKSVLMYSQKAESHSPSNMAKGASLFKDAKVENLFAIPYDLDEEGNELSPDATLKNITSIVEEIKKMEDVDSVVFDSLTGIFEIINKTKWFDSITRTDKGVKNNYAFSQAAVAIYSALIEKLHELPLCGKKIITILGAKTTAIEQGTWEALGIQPVLPYYGLAEALVFKFPSVLPIVNKNNPYGRSCIDFGIDVTKKSKSWTTGEVTKCMNFNPRLDCISISTQSYIEILPPDLYFIKEYAEKIARANKDSEKVK